jgi:ATP-dependent helicase/nuclease subunit A
MRAKPRRASDQQRDASDPSASAWVAASAGSGKTTVLVDRVIRLLLAGTAPERILCLTYTKAAAALMADRLFGELARWVTLGDAELLERIEAAGVRRADDKELALARKLFTRALETPGGLKIQTIHAFCERLLQLFPIEAGIVPGFTVMDDATARALLMEARDVALAEAARHPENPASRALAKVAARAQAEQLDELVGALLAKRSEISEVLAGSQAVTAAIKALKHACGLSADEDAETVTREMLAFDRKLYENLSLWLDGGSKTEQKLSIALRGVLDAKPEVAELVDVFFTKAAHERRKPSGLVSKERSQYEPEMADRLFGEQERLDRLLEKRAALESIEATEALLLLGSEIVAEYGERKRARGLYDFEDLIAGTRDLLTRSGAAQWVLYKLDGGIHHLLIDEAQDTSPAQWEIARALTEDFFAGAGAVQDVTRTIFAVGDRKQSIFSFQGADPVAFDAAKLHFQDRVVGAEQRFASVDLTVSHRSGPAILEAVDHVFANPMASRGLLAPGEDRAPDHVPVRAGQAGRVEIWSLETRDEADEPQPFEAPVDRPAANHPRRKLARRIAETVAGWLKQGRRLEARGRAIAPGDILILVQARNMLTDALLSELRMRNVPVARADRLKLAESIAVQDMLALARFAGNPEDDYSLACVLKSPLVQRGDGRPFDEDDLFALAHGRGSASLYERLAGHPSIHAQLSEAIAASRTHTPFAFFAGVLTRYRKRILARLGADAGEPLDALLELALDFERSRTPTLSGFLAWFAETGAELKRNMDQGSGEVRIMTVHGAKGLEANVVILADAADIPTGGNRPQLFLVESEEFPAALPLWKISSPRTPQRIAEWIELEKNRRAEENRRLFYVAMTRACDELYVCGCESTRKDNSESWYEMARSAFAANGYEEREGAFGRALPQIAEPTPDREAAPESAVETSPPAWLSTPAPIEETRGREPASVEATIDAAAARRGRAIHKLLEYLPRLAPDARLAAAKRHLARAGEDMGLAEAVTAMLAAPEFAELFEAEGLTEVSYLGRDGAGRIDRLLMSDREALIIDYKSDRAPPSDPAAIPPSYLTQIARYRDAVARMGGARTVRAAILWTETARLMEIPQAMLETLV